MTPELPSIGQDQIFNPKETTQKTTSFRTVFASRVSALVVEGDTKPASPQIAKQERKLNHFVNKLHIRNIQT